MTKIAIIEDNAQYRTAMSIILQLDEDVRLLHKLEDATGMMEQFEEDLPDVVLMDIDLPFMSGIEGVWRLKKRWPDIKVIMLTVFEDDEKIFGAIKAGANGYLLKKDSPQKILSAIQSVMQGESPMNGMIAAKMLEYFQRQGKRESQLDEYNLTSREKDILQLLIRGNSYKEIASSLRISVETLNSHIKNTYRKLDVHSRSELAARYGTL
ncbi:MAG: response regulator transcription factor [Chitinophagaceae bacterium]|nr:response regulator transcription factor [Chitinophagaceae bacterium]